MIGLYGTEIKRATPNTVADGAETRTVHTETKLLFWVGGKKEVRALLSNKPLLFFAALVTALFYASVFAGFELERTVFVTLIVLFFNQYVFDSLLDDTASGAVLFFLNLRARFWVVYASKLLCGFGFVAVLCLCNFFCIRGLFTPRDVIFLVPFACLAFGISYLIAVTGQKYDILSMIALSGILCGILSIQELWIKTAISCILAVAVTILCKKQFESVRFRKNL